MIAAADSGCDSDGRKRSAIEVADSGSDSGVGQWSDSGGQRSLIVAEDTVAIAMGGTAASGSLKAE